MGDFGSATSGMRSPGFLANSIVCSFCKLTYICATRAVIGKLRRTVRPAYIRRVIQSSRSVYICELLVEIALFTHNTHSHTSYLLEAAMYDITDLLTGYKQWIANELAQEWTPYYVNLMFSHLRLPASMLYSQMADMIEKQFYVLLCKKLDRHPNRRGRHNLSPHVLLFPDLPVAKRKKHSLREVTLNGGLHFNGFVSISPQARLRENTLVEHFAVHQAEYLRDGMRVHAKPLTDNLSGIVAYAMKTIKRGRFDLDQVILLPRTWEERQPSIDQLDDYSRVLQVRYNLLMNRLLGRDIELIRKCEAGLSVSPQVMEKENM